MTRPVVAFAPGRVNLIGEHTDHAGGLCLPIAIDLGTTITVESRTRADCLRFTSDTEPEPAVVPLGIQDPAALDPPWSRYLGGVVLALSRRGIAVASGHGTVRTTLPIGAGLSSSAALEVAAALALGFRGTPLALAEACQEAEQIASGVPCGVMDQLASAAGVAGHALLLDCATLEVTAIPMPAKDEAEILVVHSGQPRALAGSAYAERRAACEAAAAIVGPLRYATAATVAALADPLLRRRARHVVTENARVEAAVAALRSGDLVTFGQAMDESHASLAGDFEVSTPALDDLVAALRATPGVLGARLTGAGFGGCAVALVRPGSDVGPTRFSGLAQWTVRAGGGARLL